MMDQQQQPMDNNNKHQARDWPEQQQQRPPIQPAHNSRQYDKIRVLGKGSFGTAAVHRRRADCSLVVLKEIDLQQFKGDKEKCSALNEARIMSSLNHVNIIKYYNAYTTDTKLLIEMEYASMGTLANYLSLQTNPLQEQEILVVFKQIVSGLSYLHEKNIVHLDLKMANIFITIDGLVKIGDFGIAQYMQQQPANLSPKEQQLLDHRRNSIAVTTNMSAGNSGNRRSLQPSIGGGSQSQHFAGTLAYSSPERCLGDPTDFKSDIWSLGCILYELITSKPMFAGDSVPELVMRITRIQYSPIKRNISPELRAAFGRTISRRPDDRPAASELYQLADKLLAPQLEQVASQQQQQRHAKLRKRQNHGIDLSTDAAAAYINIEMNNEHNKNNQRATDIAQLRYPHSLIYQVRLDSRHIQIDRVNLPLTKRIKEICKGKSHYLALTYDNIVFGWGSRSHGELGSCGLSCSSSARLRASWSSGSPTRKQNQPPSTSRRLAPADTRECLPLTSPKAFIINELNHRKIVQVAAGDNFSVFLSKTGIVMTCGDGLKGCLGRGNFKSSFTPCMVESLLNTDIVSIASGPEHVIAICGNGKAFAWGNSSKGRLGIGSSDSSAPICLSAANVRQSTMATSGTKHVSVPHPVRFSDETVFVKSVFCGDKCTIFIDSQNRCWACGENKSNKLGLDIRRRFKKTLIVDDCWIPSEITALSKYQVVSCNVGKNHSTFITSDGKLLVYGQDIDQTYKLRSNIINGIDSHRKISFELQTRRGSRRFRGPHPVIDYSKKAQINSLKRLTKSTVINNQSFEYKQSKEDLLATETSANRRGQYPKYSLTKLQRQQVDTFLKKSRATKKMPFECVIASSCTKRFTLALTNDNRVYFWGTRSYVSNEADDRPKSSEDQPEPQLVPAVSDECFVKIGATNRSLMNTIQTLGSDQPIVHGQDPRLIANNLADLWILDYELLSSSSLSSSASSSSSAESQTDPQSDCESYKSSSSSSSSSCCSSCCSQMQQPYFSTHKHDAILDPQPIVSLYVPSMFNHSGCSLQFVDLFCFDEDKFYLVLDTTVKMHQLTISQHVSSRHQQNIRDETGNQLRLRLNSLATSSASINNRNNTSAAIGNVSTHKTKQPRRRSIGDEAEAAKLSESCRLNKPAADALDAIQESPRATILDGRNSCCAEVVDNQKTSIDNLEQRIETERGESMCAEPTLDSATPSTDGNNNNLLEVESDKATDLTSSNPCSNHSIIAASLDEPRSMSTFVANSVGNQIIVGPSMRLAAADQNMEPLRFSDSCEDKSVAADQDSSGEATLAGDDEEMNVSSAIKVQQSRQLMSRRKSRQLRDKSESTTSCTCNETSPMPSWVRNEYDMQQQQQQQQQHQTQTQRDDHMFVVDSSSATEGTCITERPIFVAGEADDDWIGNHNEEQQEDGDCQCEEATPRNSSPSPSKETTDCESEIEVPPILATSFLSRSQPDIRLDQVAGDDKDVAACSNISDTQHLQIDTTLTTRRSFATLADGNIKLDASSIALQSNLLDCDVYRNTGTHDTMMMMKNNNNNNNNNSAATTRQSSNNNLHQGSMMNVSGLSTRSSSNNPLLGSPSLVRRAELPLGGLNGRYTGMGELSQQNGASTAYLWPSNSNLHDGMQRSSSSINESKYQQQHQLHHQQKSLVFSKSVQQLNNNASNHQQHHHNSQVMITTASKHTNGSVSSITSSIRKSLLKLFC